MKSDALISDCEKHRFLLTRSWGPSTHDMLFIMLNPSTADASLDDPTIRRCIGFAKREGCGGVKVVNLISYRATKPADIDPSWGEHEVSFSKAHGGRDVPYGAWKFNHHILEREIKDKWVSHIVCAWGSSSVPAAQRTLLTIAGLQRFANRATRPLFCLGATKNGNPRHPLFVRGDHPLVSFIVAKESKKMTRNYFDV